MDTCIHALNAERSISTHNQKLERMETKCNGTESSTGGEVKIFNGQTEETVNGKSTQFSMGKRHKTFDITTLFSLPSDMKLCHVTAITLLPDNRLLVLDSTNSRLKLLDACYKATKYKIIEDKCTSICCISDNKVGVLRYDAFYTYEINEESISLDEKLTLTGMHYDAASNRQITCLVKLSTIDVYDQSLALKNTVHFQEIFDRNAGTPARLALNDENEIIFLHESTNEFVCIDTSGRIRWKLENMFSVIAIHCLGSKIFSLNREGLYEVSKSEHAQYAVDVGDVTWPETSSASCMSSKGEFYVCDWPVLMVINLHNIR